MKLFRSLRHAVASVTALTGLLVMTPSLADDIDLYTGGSATTGAAANILFVLDNTTNWVAELDDGARRGDAELKALSEIVGTLSDNVNVGLMKFAKSGNDREGEVRFHIRPMTGDDPPSVVGNRTRLQNILDYMNLNAVDKNDPDEAGASATGNETLMDGALRYFNGLKRRYDGTYVNNAGTDRKDHTDNTATAVFDPATNPSGYAWAYATANARVYNKPADTDAGCAKNYIIFIGNGWTSLPENSPTNLLNAAADLSAAVGRTFTPNTTQIYSDGTHFDEYARFMQQVGVPTNITDPRDATKKLNNSITTYSIDVCKGDCSAGKEPDQTALLKSVAKVGGGKYFQAKSTAEIKSAFATILAEIQAVNSVFASATLPISVNTQGTYENQVYIGVFRPDGSARQRWYGNLKHYRFGRYCDLDGDDKVDLDSTRALPLSGTYSMTDERVADDVAAPDCGIDSGGVKRPVKLYLGDQNGFTAIDESGNTGFIDLSAKSYWTTDSSFWTFLPTASGSVSDSPDGPEVERGGAAQKLRATWTGAGTPDGRKVYTCLGNCLLSSGTATEKTLSSSNNAFSTATSAVTTALAAPSNAAVTVTLARVGNTVTATAASHSFNTNDPVVISGATPAAYNSPTGGSFTVTKLSSTQFTYPVTETPPTSGSGTVGLSSNTTSVTSIVLSSATAGDCTSGACKPGKTVTATMVTGAVPSDPVTVAATGKNYLNVSAQALTTGAGTTTVTFPVTTTSAPAGATDLNAGVTAGTWISTGLTGAYDAVNNRFTVTKSSNYPNSLKNLTAGSSVIISSATEPKYNGTWQLSSNAANTVMTFTYVTYSGCNPCTGATATTPGATDTITFNRNVGSTTVDVQRTSSNIANFTLAVGTSVNIADAAGNYSGPHVLTANNDGAGTFSFNDNVTLGPATPATGTISAVAAGVSGGPTTANLINWMRGKDLWEDENIDGTGAFSDVRGSIHGDVLHARPVMVNYGGTVGIVGFYGSNDGYLRAIAAGSGKANEPENRTDTHTDDGNEKWAFIPAEFLSYNKLSRDYLNGTSGTSLIRYPNQACGLSTSPAGRDYRWDGPITAYQSSSEKAYYTSDPAVTTDTEPVAGCSTAVPATCYSRLREVYYTPSDPATFTYTEPAPGCSTATPATCYKRPERTWIFAAMRRGGRAIYALDVSVADTPKLMWRIDNNSSGFSDLAQTWSEPRVRTLKGVFTRADGTTTVKNPVVLIFGAGYDNEVEDQPSATVRTVTKGRGVYVVEAETGQLIRFLQPASGTLYSFSADTTPLDMDNDGYVDRIYAGDTNANIFRWDLNNATVTSINLDTYWTTRHVAALGDVDHDGGSDARKIHFAPEVLPFKLSGVVKVMVLFGTGDREKPLGNLDGSSIKTLTGLGGCPAYFTGSNPYPITGSQSGIPYTYFGPRVRDQFFGVVDSGGSTVVEANLQYVNLDPANLAPFDINSTTYSGWRVRLKTDPDGSQGDTRGEEKSVNAAKVVGGVTFFATNVPVTPDTSAGVCSNLGVALGYAVNPFTGMPALNRDNSVSGGAATYTQSDYATTFSGGGLPPTVTSGVVTVGGTPYRFIIGSGGSGLTSASAVAGQRSILNLKGTRSRLYWSYGADN